MVQVKVSPVSAETTLQYLVNELLDKPFFRGADGGALRRLAGEAAGVMPEDCFPDTYLDLDLAGEAAPLLAFLLDSRECNLINTQTAGRYFAESGITAFLAPEEYRCLTGMVFQDGEKRALETDGTLISVREAASRPAVPEEVPPAVRALTERLAALPVRQMLYRAEDGFTVAFTTGKRSPKNRFSKKKYAKALLSLLEELGAPGEPLSQLRELSCNVGLPYYESGPGYREWICCIDIAYFTVTFREDRPERFCVGIILTDKGMEHRGEGIKPSQAYQWHITDNCDQRCRHCYLFGEDALAKCVTTPWEMLLRTLDECTLDAAREHAWPMLAVTGGDPILHPRFWDLAEEIHRRGIEWVMMGNPFHLSPEVCVRLRQFGVLRYQMSLDGLEPFHDYMRKPGSFRATLEALRWLGDAGIESQLMATVSRKNMDDVIACMDVAAEHGAGSFSFARYCATSPEKAEDYPTPEEYHRFLNRYYDKRMDYLKRGCRTAFILKEHLFTLIRLERGEFTVPAFSMANRDLVCDGCHLGRTGCILSNGDIVACRRMESAVGNVWRESLAAVRTGEAMARYADVRDIRGCKDCELLNWCRGCRAVGYNATGDLHGADPCCWKQSD